MDGSVGIEAEQAANVQRHHEECLQEIQLHNNTSGKLGTAGCSTIWDGMSCWPSTAPGELSSLPCPSYIVGFEPDKVATKLCTLAGEWYVSSETNNPWTNYTQCYSSDTVKIVVPFPQLVNTTLVAQYIPLIKTVSRTGYGVSLATLIIAFCIFATFKKLRCPRNKLHMHLFVSFMMRAFTTLMKDVLFVRGVGLPSDLTVWNGETYFLHDNERNWQCKTVMSLWQYFILVNYSWILMEGIYLHNLIFLAVFSDTSAITVYIICGWGLPLLFVLPWVVLRLLRENTFCWTLNQNPNIFLLIKVPITISVLVNFVLFINIVRLLLAKMLAAVTEETRIFSVYRRWAKSTLVLMPLFGVHYIGFLTISYIGVSIKVELIWLFIDQLFASFQGFLVGTLYCLLNGEVRGELSKFWHSCMPDWRTRSNSLPLRMFHQGHSRSSYVGGSKRYKNGHTENDPGATTILSNVTNDVHGGSFSLHQT